jgi:hypothetical protein
MSLLFSIIQKTLDKKFFINMQHYNERVYWSHINNNIKTFNVWEPNFFLYVYCSNLQYSNNTNAKYANKTFIEKKFYYLKQLLDNIFLNDDSKSAILSVFSKVQRTYYAFAKLANIYRYKKSSIKINVDLYMNELNPNKKSVITILQGDSKYLFLGSDLVKTINSSLLNSSYFFAEPLQPKNPFNNIPFNKSTLYNIYFHIKYNCIINPILFHLFFKANFDPKKFLYDNECIIRDTYIKNYAENSPANVLYRDLVPMLAVNRRFTKKLLIHDDVPMDQLVDIFRPYFYLFYLNKYGVYGIDKSRRAFIELKTKLRAFVEYNPMFGRKMYKSEKRFEEVKCPETNTITTDIKISRKYSFNLSHMNFYKNNINNVIDHLINTEYNISFMRFNSPVHEADYYYEDDYEQQISEQVIAVDTIPGENEGESASESESEGESDDDDDLNSSASEITSVSNSIS